jgi:type I restriction enzyme S subunit
VTWPIVSLGDVALSIRNGIFARRPTDEQRGSRILRISAVRDGRVNLVDSRFVDGLEKDQVERFSINPGDLLVTRYNGSRAFVGTSGIVPPHDGRVIHPDKLIRVVLDRHRVDPRFVNYQLQSPQVRAHLEPRIRTTAGQSGIAGADVRSIPLAMPPLDEQRHVVDLLEDHLSRLDAADQGLRSSLFKLNGLRERTIADAVTAASVSVTNRASASLVDVGTADGDLPSLPHGWAWARLGDVAEVVGGVTKDAKKQGDPTFVEVPYLRVANVQRGRLKLEQITTIRVDPAKAKTLTLQHGDVLLNEGGDRDKLARGWVWEDQIDGCIHQNHVFRARIHEPRLDPYFLSWTANTFGGRWAERNGKQSVNLASISLSMIRKMPVIVPPAGTAQEVVTKLREQLASYDRLAAALADSRVRAATMRRALLAAAFSGRLTGSGSDLSKAQEMIGA